MDKKRKNNLEKQACRIRMDILEEVYAAQSGHPGGSLSATDILTYLYFEKMNIRPEQPGWEDRDRLVLSKGHCTPALYATLSRRGFFPHEELCNFRKLGSMLQGHPDRKYIPGVDMSTGSLGQGISAACGMAKAAKIQGKDYKVYAIVGDGELEEGEVWEACMFASYHKLDNLCVIVDNNNLQINGEIGTVSSVYPIEEKFQSFGFNTYNLDGHDFDSIENAFEKTKGKNGKPTVLIARTVKGKGVSFMENAASWHGVAPNAEQYETGMNELKNAMQKLEGGEKDA